MSYGAIIFRMVRVFSRVSDAFHLRPVKVAKEDPHILPLLESAVHRRRSTIITDSVEHEGDPRKICPYIHRGPRPCETVDALRALRASRSRFSGEQSSAQYLRSLCTIFYRVYLI